MSSDTNILEVFFAHKKFSLAVSAYFTHGRQTHPVVRNRLVVNSWCV